MATPQTMEEAKAELQRLQDALAKGEIDLAEYGQKVGPIMGLMNTALQLDTQIERPIGSQTAELTLEQPDLELQAKFAQLQRESELAALGGVKEDLSEQAKRATEKIERELYPQRFATKEYIEPISPARMVSSVRDPVKGLVRDKDTGELRKAGFLELLGEGMKRQVLQTPRTLAEIEEEYARQDRALVQSLQQQGKTKEEISDAVNKARDLRESPLFGEKIEPLEATGDVQKPEDKAMVVESPFEWGLRTFANSGSAAVAPLIKQAQDVVSILTGAPVSTRKDAGYKETQRDELGMQFITNFLLNQGVMSQQQAQLNPPDEKYDGLFNIATQGSTGSFLLGAAGEIGAPVTAPGVPFEMAKQLKLSKRLVSKPLRSLQTVRAQKIGNAINNPIEAIRYSGQKAEIDAALRTVDEGLTAKKLEKEIVEQGGVINRATLREKAAQRTGDALGSIAVLKTAVETADKVGATTINLNRLKVPQSSFLKGFFEGSESLPVSTIKDKIKNFEVRLSSVPKVGDEVVALRRVNQISDDVRNFIQNGTKPKVDAKIINRNVNKSRWLNENIWKAVEDTVPDALKKDWRVGQELTLKSFQTPLTVDEIVELGKIWKKLDNVKTWDKIPQNIRTYKNVYESVRGSVSDVMRDNFLRNVPDDFIYVSQNVAVPMKSYKSPAFNVYKDEIRKLLKFTPRLMGNEVRFVIDNNALTSIQQRVQRTGMNLPRSIDFKQPLTQAQMQDLSSIVSADIALELLDGVRLKTGTMTAQMARIPAGTPRQTLIKTGSTPSSFRIQSKGLVNATRLIISQNPVLNEIAGSLYTNLKKMRNGFLSQRIFGAPTSTLPPSLQRFSDDVMRAHNAAIDQVLDRYTQAARVAPQGKETEAFNAVLQQDLNVGVQQYKIKIDEQSIRQSSEISSLYGPFTQKQKRSQQLNVLNEKYGQENVKDFMREQGIETYDDLMNNIDFIEQNMDVVLDTTARVKQWKAALGDFFTSGPAEKGASRLQILEKYQQYVEDLVRIDSSQPFWIPNNVKSLDIGNFRQVIEELRNKDEFLRNVGLSRMKPFKEEYFTLPLLARSFEVQRLKNMQESINRLIAESPDMFIDLSRVDKGNPGLKTTEAIADKLTNQIRQSTHLAVKEGFLTDESIDILSHQIKETLFDGFAKDLWNNSSRKVQEVFFQQYLRKMISSKSAVVKDMDSFITSLYDNKVLTSNTFTRIEDQVNKVLQKVNETFFVLQQSPQQLGLFGQGKTIKEQLEIIKGLEEALPDIVQSMKVDYLRGLVMDSDGIYDGLFSQQLAATNKYFGQYGANSDALATAMKELSPRFEYVGSKNLALIYGADIQEQMDNLLKMVNATSSSQLSRYIEQLASFKQRDFISKYYLGHFIVQTWSMGRRWAVSNMLGGAYEFAMRYFGTNSFTAPFIYLTTLGDKSMKASTFAKFTGAALTGGAAPALEKLGSKVGFSTGVKSNKYLYAPAEEVIIRAQAGGAVRDYTAGELRALAEEYGINFSRADADFYDTQFERFLVDAKLNPDGSSRYGKSWLGFIPNSIRKRMWDNLSPSRRNVFTELGRFQDTQQRRLVFIDALENGETVSQAAEKARRSILDYNSLSDFEKRKIIPLIYFYPFMRTMGAEVINASYRAFMSGNNVPFKVLQLQNALNRQMSQDYVDQQDSLKGRFFNIYTGTVDGVDMYAGGIMNPQVDMFDLMSRAALIIGSGFEQDPFVRTTEQRIAKLSASLMMVGAGALETTVRGNPYFGLALDAMTVDWGKRPIPFPSELILEAEAAGRLPEVIKMYGLQERKFKTPGRPLSSKGVYWDFPQTEKGKENYRMYLFHRAIGLTSFNIIAYKGGYVAAQSRGQKEVSRANIYARQDLTITDPNDSTKTITIKDFTSYAKAIGRGDLQLSPDVLYYLYRLGQTPMKSVPIEQVEERILRDINRTLKDKLPKKE